MAASILSKLALNPKLIRETSNSVALLNSKLEFISCSKTWENNFELKTNIIGKDFFSVMYNLPKDFSAFLQYCLKGNDCYNDGKKFNGNNNEFIWLKWSINSWKGINEQVKGLIIELDNITKDKNKEALIKEAQIVSRVGGWEAYLQNFRVTWTKMVNIIHEQPLDYVPQSFEECFKHFKEGEHRDTVLRLANIAITKGTPWDTEVIMITGKGKEVWIRTKGKPEFINGKCVRLYGICQDINDRKIAELKYRKEAERAKIATTASNVGIWQFTTKDRIATWDAMSYKLHHKNPKDYKSTYEAWESAIHPDDFLRVLNEAFAVSKGEGSGVIEYRVILKDKSIRHLRAVVTFFTETEKHNNKAIGVITDITKEKESEQKLKEYAQLTGEQNNSLTNFAHMVSHDLRSHATNLSMVTGFLLEERKDEERQKLMAMLRESTESLNSTVYNLNEVVQSNANVTNKLEPINLKEVIENVKNNISATFIEKNASCILKLSSNSIVLGVPAYLDSILLNLFTNSIKYSANDRPPSIEIKTTNSGKNLILSFTDNGKGIDLNKFGNKIFGMNKTFHRNKNARGVGLYITKNQIEAMGGSISVTSEVNVGTTFTLKFITP
ncbi:PAS domain-containing protein [Maribacter vaceletii]|uniref:histidine kinase n=1 Tax=Maribacter vaceletii TaxID=1206816 RepID=A0A495EEC4_9FLAO|nr:PAS domain-containing sensor histidine kinase [Maribacter vaceletii]RKR15019.1 PAS domain-containing protein [Maribacter vaceletii]